MADERFLTGDTSGMAALTPLFSQKVANVVLVASTAKTVYWPSGYNYVVFRGQTEFWVNTLAVATIPSADDVTTYTGSVCSPGSRRRQDESSFSVISASAQVMSLEFYK